MSEAEFMEENEVVRYFADRYFKDTRKRVSKGKYQCALCKQYKPKSEFYKDSRVPCGIRSRCKECYHK